MNAAFISVSVLLLLTFVLAIPLGKYIARVFHGERTWLDFLSPVERFVLKNSGINATRQLNWKENAKALLILNLIFFLLAMIILLTQTWHPFWNPDGILSMEPTTAFNTAVSFVTNTNLQHYSGETWASYFTQLLLFCFLQFVSAGTGIAALLNPQPYNIYMRPTLV